MKQIHNINGRATVYVGKAMSKRCVLKCIVRGIPSSVILLLSVHRCTHWFGVSGKALDWFKSYLTGRRSQRIKLGNCLSSRSDLSFGVPQGSVLGPLLFTLSTTPLSSLIFGHAIPHHLYADDSQLYISFSSGNSAAALNGLQSFLASVQSWMSTNKLKPNPHETKFLLIGNERQRSKYLSMFPIELLGVKIYPAKSARNLGVIFDKNFNFPSHISAICSSCIYHIRDLRRIRGHLDLDSAKLLANAPVSSSLYYFVWDCGNWPHQAPTCFEPSGSCGHQVTTIYSQCSTAALLSSATSKI